MQNNREVYAGFFVRLFAFLVDSVLAGIASLIVKGSVYLFFSGLPLSLDNLIFDFGIGDICAYIATVMYFVLFTLYKSGKTPGKMVMGIEVINADGTRAGFWKLLFRETVGRYLSSMLFVGYIMAAFSAEKAGLHDTLSDTRVVFSAGRNFAPQQNETVVVVEPMPQNGDAALPCENLPESVEQGSDEAGEAQ